MDHSMHIGMDHGDMGHGDVGMGGKCNMNMLFNWSSENLCIIFRSWHITGPFSFLLSLIAIVILTAGYEGLRATTRKYEAAHAQRLSAFLGTTATTGGSENRAALARKGKLTMAAFYALQVSYSFFIMLLFMTYNGPVMIAVAVGAFVGYLAFSEGTSATKIIACH